MKTTPEARQGVGEELRVQTRNNHPPRSPSYGRRRLFPTEAALRHRATRWCAQTRWRVVALNYPGILRLFRDQQHAQHRARWTAHL